MNNKLKSKKGFTLIEVIAVLVLLGILAAVAVPKYIDLTEAAEERALEAGVAEINSREALEWGRALISYDRSSEAGFSVGTVDYTLGEKYSFARQEGSGTLTFGKKSIDLTKSEASLTSPAIWSETVAPGGTEGGSNP